MAKKRNTNNDTDGNFSKSKTNRSKRSRNNTKSRISRDPDVCGSNNDRDRENDPNWYLANPQLASDASKFPFSLPLGKPLPLDINPSYIKEEKAARSVPGIMSINWVPTIGNATSMNSAINIASREIYSFVRHANSGHSNYDAPDLMMYVLAMDSIYSLYSSMVRAYGTMMLFNGLNRYMPKSVIEAEGYDYDDINENLAQFRWYINQFAYKLSGLYVPKGMTYYDRHIWLNSTIFVDSDDPKAQTYLFRQHGYYQYTADVSIKYRVRLAYHLFPTNMTVKDVVQIMNDLIDPILADEAMNIMSGDILKAFGAQNLFMVSPIDENYVTLPVYSREVMSQIQNLTIMGKYNCEPIKDTGYHGMDILQKIDTSDFSSAIEQTVYFQRFYGDKDADSNTGNPLQGIINGCNILESNRIITLSSANPTSEEILVATRLTNSTDEAWQGDQQGTSDKKRSYLATCSQISTEFVTSIIIWSVAKDGSYYTTEHQRPYVNQSDLSFIAQLSAFDWHPIIPIMETSVSDAKFHGYLSETMNYTIMNRSDLARIHETCLYSEFMIPDMRKLSSNPYR